MSTKLAMFLVYRASPDAYRAEGPARMHRQTISSGVDDGRDLGYDHLVYAIGSATPRIEHAFTIDDPAFAAALRDNADGVLTVCGAGLTGIEAAAEAVHGPDQDVVRFELFSRAGVEPKESVPLDGDNYELVLAKSGHTLRMKPDANILDTVLALGVEVENDCRDGICGSCITSVLAGTVDHQDLVLTRKEQAAMNKMMICCSRPTSERLELDL